MSEFYQLWSEKKKVRILAQTLTSAQYILDTIDSDSDCIDEIQKNINSAIIRCHRLENEAEEHVDKLDIDKEAVRQLHDDVAETLEAENE